ncbi:NAD-dependent epimerase/dehydratase family protein [Nocardia jejuensis]|uniref:NAD-dependent epimerase/dehydratase family protein n=1 Tax=Nocardia jejuensis TaxID=328049 RepID=UPI0009FF5310|nr:NAD-dependent epimerase/dehydratase family protein [Nocardia jejuensis]
MSSAGPEADRSRVLLTGAAGYIGSHVHRALRAAGHEVIAVDAMLESVHGSNAAAPQDVSRLDIRDHEALEPLLAGIDVVCHLAAAVPPAEIPVRVGAVGESSRERPAGGDGQRGTDRPDGAAAGRREDIGHGVGPCVRGPSGDSGSDAQKTGALGMARAAEYATHNDAGTAVLLAAMERAGVRRLVLGSSVAVYGEGRYRGVRSGPFFPGLRRRGDLDRGLFDHRAPRTGEVLTWEPIPEDSPLRPRSAYAASKVAQEHYALAWVANTGASATVLRYGQVYGAPVESGNGGRSAESGVVARFRADLIAGRAPRIFEDGGQVRDFVQVRDVAAATLAAIDHQLTGFVPLNIASGRPLTLWEVASTMSKAVGGPDPVVTGQYRLTDIRHLVVNSERARHALDFTARIAPATGLVDYAKYDSGRREHP